MKSRLFLMGTLAFTLMFGLIAAGCDTGTGGDGGGDGGGAPGDVTLTPDSTRIIVTWSAVSGATGYQAVYGRGLAAPPATLSATNMVEVGAVTTVTITGLTNGDEYNVWVRAKKADSTFTSYSAKKTATPRVSDEAPAKPVITVTATDTGQIKITWGAAQYANNYDVRIGTTNDSMNSTLIPQASAITTLTYTTTAANLTPGNLQYYLWVVARNTAPNPAKTTPSDPASVTVIDAPLDKAAFEGSTWKAELGSNRYVFTAATVAYYNTAGDETAGTGTYEYAKPNLTISINAASSTMANRPGEWDGMTNIPLSGRSFDVDGVTYIRQQ